MPGDTGDRSTEENLKSPKTTHGAYLGLGLPACIPKIAQSIWLPSPFKVREKQSAFYQHSACPRFTDSHKLRLVQMNFTTRCIEGS
jgi:hypothetical protein